MNKKKTILLVDDEPAIRDLLTQIISDAGYEVLSAENGKTAYQIFSTQKADLIISDIRMPGWNGIELLEKIKSANSDMSVVFVTGYDDLSIAEAYDKGVEAIFSKPLNMDALLSTIRLALEPKDERWQRRSIRIEARTNVEVKLDNLDGAINSNALNLGKGGMFVAMSGQLPKVSAFIKFKIQMTQYPEIQGTGIVRWAREMPGEGLGRGIGIEFIEFPENCRIEFLKLLNSIQTKSFIPIS